LSRESGKARHRRVDNTAKIRAKHLRILAQSVAATPTCSVCVYNYTVGEPGGSTPLIPKPATEHDPGPVPSALPTFMTHLPNIHLNVILPSPSRSSKWPITRRCPMKILYAFLVYSHPSYMPSPSQPQTFHYHNNTS